MPNTNKKLDAFGRSGAFESTFTTMLSSLARYLTANGRLLLLLILLLLYVITHSVWSESSHQSVSCFLKTYSSGDFVL